jgi:hypothetical protein
VIGLRKGERSLLRGASGWVAALMFVIIGFWFANSFSLMTNVGAWGALLEANSFAGAATGTALNTADATLWPRWLMMFGLALTTSAAYVVVDTGVFAGGESEDYKRWALGMAFRLYTLGIIWFGVTGAWYIFGALEAESRAMLLGMPALILTALTALAPGLPWLLILAGRGGVTRGRALLTGLAQFGVLALNAVSRQILQNAELAPFMDVTAEPVNVQWSPMILFLVLFVAGLGVVAWIVSQVVKASQQPAAS